MFCYVKLSLCLLLYAFETNAIPLEDSNDSPNLFNIHGLSQNNATGATFIEGDIAVPLKNGRTAYTRAPKWPNGVVPVEFDSIYTTEQKNVIIGAMTEIMKNTNNCIRFVWKTSSSSAWLKIQHSSGCWSYMGKSVQSGKQDVSLQIPGCIHHSVALHELLHALGFVHEQTRPDRDQYVQIQTGNILSGQEHNFKIFSRSDVNMLNLPYDFGSIMHYRSDAFTSNGRPTMKVISSSGKQWESKMGRGDKMSDLDIKKLKAYYSCP